MKVLTDLRLTVLHCTPCTCRFRYCVFVLLHTVPCLHKRSLSLTAEAECGRDTGIALLGPPLHRNSLTSRLVKLVGHRYEAGTTSTPLKRSPQTALAMAGSCFLLGVFSLSALITYNILSMMFGHNSTSHMLNQHRMEALNRREDAFNFDVGIPAGATERSSRCSYQTIYVSRFSPVLSVEVFWCAVCTSSREENFQRDRRSSDRHVLSPLASFANHRKHRHSSANSATPESTA